MPRAFSCRLLAHLLLAKSELEGAGLPDFLPQNLRGICNIAGYRKRMKTMLSLSRYVESTS
jgi:hypothetical protein